MKPIRVFIFSSTIILLWFRSEAQKSFVLIPKKSGKINTTVISKLSPSLKALAAFYGAMGGTNCAELKCELTMALGLGPQGSPEQKQLIQKYFPEDKAAKLVLGQDCYLPPSGSSSFSNFKFLSFTTNGETITVNYQLTVFDHGNTKNINGPDIYTFSNNTFKNKKRILYAWTEK